MGPRIRADLFTVINLFIFLGAQCEGEAVRVSCVRMQVPPAAQHEATHVDSRGAGRH